MSKHTRKKINQLLINWQKGEIKTTNWLSKHGYSSSLLNKYKKSKLIESLGNGAYKIYGDEINWYSMINTIQFQLEKDIYIGSNTALSLFGISHFVKNNIKKIILYIGNDKLPMWVLNNDWKVRINIKYKKLFNKNYIKPIIYENYKLQVSVPEQAILEMISDIPKEYSIDEIKNIFENLTMLRPKIVEDLLINCNSVKTKRIFLFLADQYNYKWISKINRNEIYLGKGKRQIIPNGKLNEKYKIII